MTDDQKQWLDKMKGKDLITVSHAFSLQFGLSAIEAGKIIIEWVNEND